MTFEKSKEWLDMVKKLKSKESVFRIEEMQQDADNRMFFPVTVICEGLGNLRDKNYYTAQAIISGAAIYEGAQAYYDHPSEEEEQQQPNRTINKLLGHYEQCKAVRNLEGVTELRARLYPIAGMSRADAIEALNHAVIYKTKFPDKDFVGISINGDGEGETLDYADFCKKYNPPAVCMEKLKQIEGSQINAITKLSDAFSADVVTAPGAGGKINTKEERRTMKLFTSMKKFFSGLETNDFKTAEAAVKDMLEAKDDDKDDKKEKKESKKEDSVSKMLQAVKKETKKKEDESEKEYESRLKKALQAKMEDMMSEAMKSAEADDKDAKKEADEKEKKEAADKKEKKEADEKKEAKSKKDDGDGDDDDKAKEKKEKEKKEASKKDDEDEEESEKKEKKEKEKKEKKESAADDDSIEGLKKQMEAMAAKIELFEAEAKNSKKESAEAQTELKIAKRQALIEAKLSKSGYRREITALWKPVLEKCRTEEEMDSVMANLKEAASRANAERFLEFSSHGTIERSSEGSGSNDDLFSVAK